MRKAIVVFFALLLAPIAASSRLTCEWQVEGSGKAVPGSPAPVFTWKEPFKHLAALPEHVLALLRTDKDNTEKFQACRSREGLAEMPRKWFVATEVKLVNGELPGLVVKAGNACLWDEKQDQEVGGFRVFRQVPTGYQLVYYRTIYTYNEGKYAPFTYSQLDVDFLPATTPMI